MSLNLPTGPIGSNIIFDTATLIKVVPNLKRPQSFLLDKYFPNTVTSDTDMIAIDVEIGKRRMSPFVSPLVEGKLVESLRYQTNAFKPPYIKDKRAPDLRKPVRRMIGEQIGGDMSAQEREAANLEYEMQDQLDMLTRREEWMAAQALVNGSVLVKGEGFPDTLVDFGRDPSLTIALTGGQQWTPANVLAGTANPTGNIEAWQRNVLKKSGAAITDIVMTTSPFSGFLADPLVKGAMFYPKLGDSGNVIDPGPSIGSGAIYKGRWGQYDIWIYNDWFVESGTDGQAVVDKEYPMIPDGTILLLGPDIEGTRAYATILDPEFNYATMRYAPKTWVLKDPAQRLIMMQSAPLVIPSRPNASVSVNVCPAVYG